MTQYKQDVLQINITSNNNNELRKMDGVKEVKWEEKEESKKDEKEKEDGERKRKEEEEDNE